MNAFDTHRVACLGIDLLISSTVYPFVPVAARDMSQVRMPAFSEDAPAGHRRSAKSETVKANGGMDGNAEQPDPIDERLLVTPDVCADGHHHSGYLFASSLNNLAGLLKSKGDCTAEEPLYRRALAIREKTLGPDIRIRP